MSDDRQVTISIAQTVAALWRRHHRRRVAVRPSAEPMIASVGTATAGEPIHQTHCFGPCYRLVLARPVRGIPRELVRRRRVRQWHSQQQSGRTCPGLRRRTGPLPIGRLRPRIQVGGLHFAANWGSRGSSSCKECSGRKLETETAMSVISRSRSFSRMAEMASLSATSVSVSVVEIATANVTDRVTERM